MEEINEEKNNIPDFYLYLKKVFYPSKKIISTPMAIIKSKEDIPKLMYSIRADKNETSETIHKKIDNLQIINFLFHKNDNLIFLFSNNCNTNVSYFLEPVIELYINEALTDIKDELILEEFIMLIISYCSIPKFFLEYICQKIGVYLRYNSKNEILDKLSQKTFLKYLNLLEIFYTNSLDKDLKKIYNDNNILENNFNDNVEANDEIKNFFYFNGLNSKVDIVLNTNSTNLNCDFPTLANGLSFVFWINFDKDLINDYYNINPGKQIIILSFILGLSEIKLVLSDGKHLLFTIDKIKSEPIDISGEFKNNEWNNFCIIFYPNKEFYANIILNGKIIKYDINISHGLNFNFYDKIENITLFQNFIGKVNSFLISSNILNNDLIKFFANSKGFYKIKILYKFLCSIDSNYSEYLKVSKYSIQNTYKDIDFSPIKILKKDQNILNMTGLFCPFAYNKKRKQVDDVFGNYEAIIISEDDGAIDYKKYYKNIQYIGGINNLLPIVELMLISYTQNKDYSFGNCEYIENLLTEEIFLKFMHIIKKIIEKSKHNFSEAVKSQFFSHLGLFLEKFPSKIYNNLILNVFDKIGKQTFQYPENSGTFIDMILLNEKIFSKFSEENELKMWDNLNKLFTSDYSILSDSFNMSKICLLLRYYDKDRYNIYCCKRHRDLIENTNDNNEIDNINNIMNPNMNSKINKLFETIQLYVNTLSNEGNTHNLFKLLSLDLSPCLQKKIIQVYKSFFSNTKISDKIKNSALDILINNQFVTIFEFALNLSLFDVRIELIDLFRIISIKSRDLLEIHIKINNYIIFDYMSEYMLPDNLKTIQVNEEKMYQIIPLYTIVNKKFYDEDTSKLFDILKEWCTYTVKYKDSNKSGIFLYANKLVINIIIKLASRISFFYIDCVLILIFSLINNFTIYNRSLFFKSPNLFKWLTELYFFFNNKENEKLIEEKDKQMTEAIKLHLLEILKSYFSESIEQNTNDIYYSYNYILTYANYLREQNKYNQNFVKEVIRITRKLLNIIISISQRIFDLGLIRTCFEFMLLFNDQEKEVQNISNTENIDENLDTQDDFLILTNKLENSNNEGNNSLDLENNKNLMNESNVIPDFILNNMFIKESSIYRKQSCLNLYSIWEDYHLYEIITEYYWKNYFGLNILNKPFKNEKKESTNEIYKKLIKEYGENKQNRNILIKTLYNLLNIEDTDIKSNKTENKNINILSLILIMLCIAYDTSEYKDEKSFIAKQIIELLFFFVLSAINISNTDKNYSIIEEKISNLLGYGLIFLQKREKAQYVDFITTIISPILEVDKPKISIKNIFKKTSYKNTLINKLFSIEETESSESKKNKISKSVGFGYKSEMEMKVKDKNGTILFKGDTKKIIKIVIYDTFKEFILDRQKLMSQKDEIIQNINIKNNNIKSSTRVENELNSVKEETMEMIPLLVKEIRKYSSTFIQKEKERRNEYKKVKKKLFSWRGFWSQRDIFYEHPEYLKLKTKNHFTKEMTRVLLTPVLDLEFYLPPFKQFNKDNLFNKDDFKYGINLNIKNLLQGKSENFEEKNKKKEENSSKKKIKYLECIYKFTYAQIWELYLTYFEDKFNLEDNLVGINFHTNDIKSIITNSLINNNSNTTNQKMIKPESFKCCMIKPTHHVKGSLICQDTKIIFTFSQREETEIENNFNDDPSYDKDLDNCFGSTFKKNLSDIEKVYIKINYDDIWYIFYRKYFYQENGIEIYTKSNKSYFFNFKNNKDLSLYMEQLMDIIKTREIKVEDIKGKKVIGYEQIFSEDKKYKTFYISSKMEDWRDWKISTLEYLMWINIYSGRSYNDLTQYPIFPWIISNYKTNELNDDENNFRNLSSPIGMIEYNNKSLTRKETFIDKYETSKTELKESFSDFNYQDYLKKGDEYYYNYRNKKLKLKDTERNSKEQNDIADDTQVLEINQLPSYYGSHYSNPTYVSHFLVRVFPYSFISIGIQGAKFDNPDRMFMSIEKTYDCCMTLKDDLRELIPEFYLIPDFLKNNNNLNLSQDMLDSNGEKIVINHIELPPWANKSPYTFVSLMRNNLEKQKIKINKWIDLIFGSYQFGEKAEEIHNIFQPHTYDKMVRIEMINDVDMRNAMMRLVEVGVTPYRIFEKDTKNRVDVLKSSIFSKGKGLFLYESKKLSKFLLNNEKYKKICSKLYTNSNLVKNKNISEIVFPSIIAIKYVGRKNIKIFTNNNYWYHIKKSIIDIQIANKLTKEESNFYSYKNISSEFAVSFQMNLNNTPFVIYAKDTYIIKGGFWDNHLEVNSLINENEVSFTIYVDSIIGPITHMKMTSDEKTLICGTHYGNIVIFNVDGLNIQQSQILCHHSGSITSLTINDTLNMFATSSIDGYIHMYTLPSLDLVRSIQISQKVEFNFDDENYNEIQKIENLYANDIFLSSNPLPCIVIFIKMKNKLITYSINGGFVSNYIEEDKIGHINSPILFQGTDFNDYLIYGTDEGFVNIIKLPELTLINKIKPYINERIKTLELSKDKRFCYIWSDNDKIFIIKDINTSSGFEIKDDNKDQDDISTID